MEQTVVIAEPWEILRIGLRTVFLEDPRVSYVYEVSTYEALQAKLASCKIDLVVINQVLVEDFSQLPDLNVVILTSKPDMKALQAAYKHGVRAYLLDQVTGDLLRTTLCSVQGTFLVEPTLASWLMDGAAGIGKYEGLTHQEREIVNMIYEGLDYVTIARRLHITRATLRTYVKNINRKLKTRISVKRRQHAQSFCL